MNQHNHKLSYRPGLYGDDPLATVGYLRGVFLANHLINNDNLTRTSCRRAAARICPRPGLQVVTRYTSCTHMDRSPLLYVHVGLPVQPTKVAWWPWPLTLTLKVVSESRVTWATSSANFSLPRPLCSRVRPNVCDRQTDRHHTKASLNAPAC